MVKLHRDYTGTVSAILQTACIAVCYTLQQCWLNELGVAVIESDIEFNLLQT